MRGPFRCGSGHPQPHGDGTEGRRDYTIRMRRRTIVVGWLLVLCPAAVLSCQPLYAPLDTASLPSTVTSAEPRYISTETVEPPTEDTSAEASSNDSAHLRLPADVSFTSDRTATCPRNHCWRSWIVPRPTDAKQAANTPYPDLGIAPPVAVWQEVLRPNVKLDFPRAKGIGLLGVVLQGIVTVAPSEGASLAALDPWKAFDAPGVGVSLTTNPSGGSVVLVAYALDAPLDRSMATLRGSEKALYWDKRPGTFAVEDLAPALPTLPCSPQGTCPEARPTPSHAPKMSIHFWDTPLPTNHPSKTPTPDGEASEEKSWQVFVPVVGTGILSLAGRQDLPDAKSTCDAQPGKVVMVPPGVTFSYAPTEQQPIHGSIRVVVPEVRPSR